MWKISCYTSFGCTFGFHSSSILRLAFLMKELKTLSFGDDYVVVEYHVNSTIKTSHSVLSVMENVDAHTWCCCGSCGPRSEIRVYLCQVLLILSIVLVSIYNFTNQQVDQQLWLAQLCSCMGYLLPNHSMKSLAISISLYHPTTPWNTIQKTPWHNLQVSCPVPSITQETGKWVWWKFSIPITGSMYQPWKGIAPLRFSLQPLLM